MKQETLKRAKELEEEINQIDKAIKLPNDSSHYAMLEHYGINASVHDLPRDLNPKIKALLLEEKARREALLERLSDETIDERYDSEGLSTGSAAYAYEEHPAAKEQQPSPANIRRRKHLVFFMVGLYLWMFFCVVYYMLGFSNLITTISNTLFTGFLIYMVDAERRRLKQNKTE